MKKIIKSRIFTFILGGIILGSIGVYAATQYKAEEISYKNTTVKNALDDLYTKKTSLPVICNYKNSTYGDSSNHLSVGTMYECDPGDGTKRNFFVLAVDTNKVKLIMEHNITEGSSETTMTWMDAMKYFRTGAGASTKTAWTNVQDIDLPMAQDIANAVGNTGWNMEDKNYDGWFYLDKNGNSYGQTQVANASNLSKYRWLYNYTRECKDYGCDSDTSLGSTEAYGYWARDIVAQQKGSTVRAWVVNRNGYLDITTLSIDTHNGVRPVITVLKSQLN